MSIREQYGLSKREWRKLIHRALREATQMQKKLIETLNMLIVNQK